MTISYSFEGTYLLKMFTNDIELDIHKKIISMGLKPHKKKFRVGGAAVLIGCLGHHSRTFSALKLLLAHFAIFFPLDYKESFLFLICRKEMKKLGELSFFSHVVDHSHSLMEKNSDR